MINSDLHINNDQFNVGSPFVILTSNPAVLEEENNSSFKSGVDPTDPNTVLLTLQEGNLISFTEKNSKETNGKPQIFLKFLDPEMTILPRLFDHNALSVYRGLFNKLASGAETKTLKVEVPSTSKKTKKGSDTSDTEFVINNEFTVSASTDASGNQVVNIFDETIMYLTYGMGNDYRKVSPWRKVKLTSFYISQDTTDNAVVELTMAYGALGNAEGKSGALSLQSAYNSLKPSLVGRSIQSASEATVAVPIMRVQTLPTNSNLYLGSTTATSQFLNYGGINKILEDQTPLILSLLENLYQKYLLSHRKGDFKYFPFVFLSPKVGVELKNYLDTILKAHDDAGITDAEIFPELYKLNILKKILNSCGISIINGKPPSVGGSRKVREETLYLTINHSPGEDPEVWVMESLRKLYSALNITDGMSPMGRIGNEFGQPLHITDIQHKKLFINQFCERTASENGYLNKYALKKSDVEKTRTRTQRRTYGYGGASTTVNEEVLESYTVLEISKEEHNVTLFDTALESGDTEIKVFTDAVIGDGLIMPLCPNLSLATLEVYIETLQGSLRIRDKDDLYCNTYKFMFDYRKTKEPFLDYIYNTHKLFRYGDALTPEDIGLPSDFDIGRDAKIKAVIDQIPLFICNRENANVLEVTSTEKGVGFAKLIDVFSLVESGILATLKGVVDGEEVVTLEDFDERFDEVIQESLDVAYRRNPTIYSMLLSMSRTLGKSDDELDKAALPLFEGIRKEVKKLVSESLSLQERGISWTGMTAAMGYIQKMSNTIAVCSIKTLPFFNYTAPRMLGKTCLFLDHSNFYALTRNRPTKGFLSGIYLIDSIEHIISRNECTSKFTIFRQELATGVLNKFIQNPESE